MKKNIFRKILKVKINLTFIISQFWSRWFHSRELCLGCALDHSVLTLPVHVHPAQLALQTLPRVALHDLGADVAAGDVLVGVLSKLVAGLQERRRSCRCCWSLAWSSGTHIRRLSAFNILECVHPLALDLTSHFGTAISNIWHVFFYSPEQSRGKCLQTVLIWITIV